MAVLQHDGIPPAAPDTVVIWRYMDWYKFESLVREGALFFSRADKQQDPFEGHLPESTRESLLRQLRNAPEAFLERAGASPEAIGAACFDTDEKLRRFALLSCWHVHPTESLRMWAAYTTEPRAVAVQTTVGDLKRCLEESSDGAFDVGFVRYLPREELYIPPGDQVVRYFRKEPAYAFERELRALTWNCPTHNLDAMDWEGYEARCPKGALVRVRLANLIRAVRILPNAPPGLRDDVVAMLDAHGVRGVDVRESAMPYGPPLDVRRAMTEGPNAGALRGLLGDRGLLGPDEYDIVVDGRFQEGRALHRLTDAEAREAVLSADRYEYLTPPRNGPDHLPNYALFLKTFHHLPAADRYSLLLLTCRNGPVVEIVDAWRFFHADVPLPAAPGPVTALRAFLDVYGRDVTLRGSSIKTRLLTNQPIPATRTPPTSFGDLPLAWDRTAIPEGHTLRVVWYAQQPETGPDARLALGACLDATALQESLDRRADR